MDGGRTVRTCLSLVVLLVPGACARDKDGDGAGPADTGDPPTGDDSGADSHSGGLDTQNDSGVDRLRGQANLQAGFSADPDARDCDLLWALRGAPLVPPLAWCPDCLWGFDVAFTYDAAASYDGGECFGSGDEDFVWTLAYHPTYYAEYGYGALYYYAPDEREAYPILPALWFDPVEVPAAHGRFLAIGGYYEYGPLDYAEFEDYYYTRRWQIDGYAY